METKETSLSTTRNAALDNEHRLRGFALASVLIALMLTLLLEALDQTIVGTALPRIVASHPQTVALSVFY